MVMTYHGPDPRMERHPAEAGATPRQACWSLAVGAAIVVILGLTFYGINAKRESQTATNPPAVNAAPAPAAGVAPPAPQTTTGQTAPSAAPETTGQGAAAQGTR
jgi:hypothetical protein